MRKFIFLVLLSGCLIQYGQAQSRFTGNLQKVVKIQFHKGSNFKGSFTQTGQTEWTQTNNLGTTIFKETNRSNGKIFLKISGVEYYFDLNEMRWFKIMGNMSTSFIAYIDGIEEGSIANNANITNTFIKVPDKNPVTVKDFTDRAKLYEERSELSLAIRDYTSAIQMSSGWELLIKRAGLYEKAGQIEDAKEDYETAVDLYPNEFTYTNRGYFRSNNGMPEEALSDFKKALEIKPGDYWAMGYIVIPYIQLGEFKLAAESLTDYKAKYGRSMWGSDFYRFFTIYLEAVEFIAMNNFYAAEFKIKEAEETYFEQRNAGGLKEIRDAQKMRYADILSLKGYICEQMKKPDEAKKYYTQSLIINPTQTSVKAGLSRLVNLRKELSANDQTPPEINILEPATEKTVSIETANKAGFLLIRGKAIDQAGIKKILINNITVNVEENGYFEKKVELKIGRNDFSVLAEDNKGNKSSQKINIQAVAAKVKPEVKEDITLDIPELEQDAVFHAVLIAENDYRDDEIPDLNGPAKDMRRIYALLTETYTFDPKNVDTFVNASRQQILEKLIIKTNQLKEKDNLFIFYAGHGQLKKKADAPEAGFLVPSDAKFNKLETYISSEDLVNTIKNCDAQHILFTADACFAGALFRSLPSDAPDQVQEAYRDKSRKLLTSGNRQSVPDESDFMKYFSNALHGNQKHYVTAEQLVDSFKNEYNSSSHQRLQYKPILGSDEGGAFVFIKRK